MKTITTTITTTLAILLSLTITQPVLAHAKICVQNKGGFFLHNYFRPRLLARHGEDGEDITELKSRTLATGRQWCYGIGPNVYIEGGDEESHPVAKIHGGKTKHCANFNLADMVKNNKERTYKVYGSSLNVHCKTVSQDTHRH